MHEERGGKTHKHRDITTTTHDNDRTLHKHLDVTRCGFLLLTPQNRWCFLYVQHEHKWSLSWTCEFVKRSVWELLSVDGSQPEVCHMSQYTTPACVCSSHGITWVSSCCGYSVSYVSHMCCVTIRENSSRMTLLIQIWDVSMTATQLNLEPHWKSVGWIIKTLKTSLHNIQWHYCFQYLHPIC